MNPDEQSRHNTNHATRTPSITARALAIAASAAGTITSATVRALAVAAGAAARPSPQPMPPPPTVPAVTRDALAGPSATTVQHTQATAAGVSTPAKRRAVAADSTPRRVSARENKGKKAMNRGSASPVFFECPTVLDIRPGQVWALYGHEGLPTDYALVNGVRGDKIKCTWLRAKQPAKPDADESFVYEIDDDEEQEEQELGCFSHYAERTMRPDQRQVRIAPKEGEVWAANDSLQTLVLYEILEVYSDRWIASVLVHDGKGTSMWERSQFHQYVHIFPRDVGSLSHRVPSFPDPIERHRNPEALFLDDAGLCGHGEEGAIRALVDGEKRVWWADDESQARVKSRSSRTVQQKLPRTRCVHCTEEVCGGYTIACVACSSSHAHPWCVPQQRLMKETLGFAWKCANCLVLPEADPPSGGSGKGLGVTVTDRVLGSRQVRETSYHFLSNKHAFGITQYDSLFNPGEIDLIEHEVRALNAEAGSLPAHNNSAPATGRFKLTAEQVVNSPMVHRRKVFFRARYINYRKNETCSIVNDVPDNVPASIAAAERVLSGSGLLRENVGMVVVNTYERGGSIGVHQDDATIFRRPIVSLRVGQESVLTFGAYGLNGLNGLFRIPLKRGTVTVMEGLAADVLTHSIDPRDVHGWSASVLWRILC